MEAWEARSGGGKGSLKLFGVTICGGDAAAEAGAGVGEEVLRKSKSTGNLASAERAAESEAADRGYLSDGGVRKPGTRRRRRAGVGGHERKKGLPWTEEEHRTFLEGLEKLGKGDWRGISRKFVITRTPTQVASHAQKYFIRQSIPSNRRRRSSLFDVVINDTACIPETVPAVSFNGAQNGSDESNFLSQDKKRVTCRTCYMLSFQSEEKEDHLRALHLQTTNLLIHECRCCAQVGTLELNSVWVSSLGQERHAGLHLMVDRGGVSRPNSCCCVGRAPGLVKIEPASAGPEKSQTLTLMHDAPQSTDSGPFKLQTHQPAPSQGYVQLFLCRPSQANTARQVTKGNDLDLSIAPPGPLCF